MRLIRIDGKTISIPAGDKGTVTFRFRSGAVQGDVVKLFVGKSTWQDAIIVKTGTVGSDMKVSFSFTGTETSIQPMRYCYSLRVVNAAGYDSPILDADFVVEGVVSNG